LKPAALIACAIVVCGWTRSAPAQDPRDESPRHPPAASAEPATAGSSPRELLAQVGLDAAFFAGFADDRPLDPAEREKLELLLYRLARIRPATMKEHEQPPRTLFAMAQQPAEYRGDVILVTGDVKHVAREELAPELREKFGFDACYRCQVVTHAGTSVTLYALSIPRAWTLDEPIDERASALAMFVKLLPAGPNDPPRPEVLDARNPLRIPVIQGSLLMVTERVAWHPATLLGELGMDVGLLDLVRDGSGLDERESFYRLLEAVRGAPDGRIERAGRESLATRRDLFERMTRNRDLGPKAQAEAQRGLARAEQNADDVVPLFNQPAKQRGKLFVLAGEALRAIEIRVDDPDIVRRFGIDHYYEVEIVTTDSQNNPIVCCVAELPSEMPLGPSIHENVRVTGFFLKSWAFDTPKSSAASPPRKRQQLAPLLIAQTVQVLGPPTALPPSATLAGVLVVAILAFAVVAWFVWRGDRRALAQAAGGPLAQPPPPAPEGWDDAPRESA
jgi:hypothetical protein